MLGGILVSGLDYASVPNPSNIEAVKKSGLVRAFLFDIQFNFFEHIIAKKRHTANIRYSTWEFGIPKSLIHLSHSTEIGFVSKGSTRFFAM